jgi:hypothetical protein
VPPGEPTGRGILKPNRFDAAERNLAILRDRVCRQRSYRELADQHGLTPERVRQILMRSLRLISNYDHAIFHLEARVEELTREVRIRDRLLAPSARVQLSWERLREESVAKLALSIRAWHALDRYQVRTLGELWDKTDAELLDWKDFGRVSLAELRHAMIRYCAAHGWTVVWNRTQDRTLGQMELGPSKTVPAI